MEPSLRLITPAVAWQIAARVVATVLGIDDQPVAEIAIRLQVVAPGFAPKCGGDRAPVADVRRHLYLAEEGQPEDKAIKLSSDGTEDYAFAGGFGEFGGQFGASFTGYNFDIVNRTQKLRVELFDASGPESDRPAQRAECLDQLALTLRHGQPHRLV